MSVALWRSTLRAAVALALLGLLLIGSLVVGSRLLRPPEEDLSVVLPVPSASLVASPNPLPSAGLNLAPSASPVASPGRLLVTHDVGTGAWIELASIGGSSTTRLAQGRDPAWMASGLVAYSCTPPGKDALSVCAVDPKRPDPVMTLIDGADRPAPAPDGRSLMVHRGQIDVGETWRVVMNSDVAGVLHSGAFLRWSPDGAWLAGQPESASFQVAIIGADGQGFRVLAPGYDPAWSPSGDRIAYEVADDQGTSLRVVDVASGKITNLFVAPASAELVPPAWLPDGGLVFGVNGNLWLLRAGQFDGPVQLTSGLAIRRDPLSVSQDGRWIAFTEGSSAATRVGIVSVDGDVKMLDLGSGAVSQPQWVPDSTPGPDSTSGPDSTPGATPPAASPQTGSGPVGTAWVRATIPAVADRPVGQVEAVTAGGPGFVAVGRGCTGDPQRCEGVVWTSTDGRSWVRAPASDALNTGASFPMSGPEIGMFDVAAGGPGIVAIGYAARPDMQATIWFSPDGSSWQRIPLGGTATTRVHAVTWDGQNFVLVGEVRPAMASAADIATAKARAAVWTSPDGRTWTRVPDASALDAGGFIDTMEDPSSGGMADVIGGPGGLVAVGSVCRSNPSGCWPAAWTSSDGLTWARVAGVPAASGRLESVAASRAGYVAVGAQACSAAQVASGGCPALILTSPDGATWTQQAFEQTGGLRTVTRIGDRLFATAPDGPVTLWTSTDGSTWTPGSASGGPPLDTSGNVAAWHLASTPYTAVWLGAQTTAEDPAAWVSGGTGP